MLSKPVCGRLQSSMVYSGEYEGGLQHMIGSTEILIIAGVVVVLFGARAVPRFARSLGEAKRELEKGLKDGESKAGDGNSEGDTGGTGGGSSAGSSEAEENK